MNQGQETSNDITNAFRENYYRLERAVEAALTTEFGDSVVLERLREGLGDFSVIVERHRDLLDDDEAAIIATNITLLDEEVRRAHRQALDASHHGTHHPVTYVYTGNAGRPRAVIDRDWLAWAHQNRSTSAIARYLGLSRQIVRDALIEYGLAERQEYPFEVQYSSSLVDEGINPYPDNGAPGSGGMGELPPAHHWQQERQTHGSVASESYDFGDEVPDLEPIGQPHVVYTQIRSYTTPVSQWTDEELDDAIARIRLHYPNAGLSFLRGSLLTLGQRVPQERIRESLLRVDPVRRIFERRTIERRTYSVPGPNSLWHHDGQHGLIRWRIVFHGFIDGYSRLITALRASNNNRASTVMDVFTEAIRNYRVPSRVRGDHGTENLGVAAFMEEFRGAGRGSYIWGRSVHNVRIERLWVDLTVSLGSKWAQFFELLELQAGLDPNNANHIWLLHYLYLADINEELAFFIRTWNHHPLQMRGQRHRSPIDMYGFDMLVHGIRGDDLDTILPQDLELYGVDWEALRDQEITEPPDSHGGEETSLPGNQSRGIPQRLSEVVVEEPTCELSIADVEALYAFVQPVLEFSDHDSLVRRWTLALAFCRTRSRMF